MADKIVTDKGTISLDIVDEIIKSNELRSSGEDYGYYYDKKTNRLEIGDVNAVTSNMYSDLNEQIQQGGVDTTEELKDLAGKATGIDVPPSGDIPIVTDLTGIRMPSKEKMASNVTSFLTKLGVPMDNSMFVGELLTDVNQSGMGILDATGIGELSELAEGFTKFQSGLASDDPKLALGGLAQTTLGAVGAYPFFKTLFDKASPKAKEALSGLATKAREYKSSQTPGTKLLSTDPTDPAVDAIIKLDQLVNSNTGKPPSNLLVEEDLKVVLEERSKQMNLKPKDRVQPSNNDPLFDTSPESYENIMVEQKETYVPRNTKTDKMPLNNRVNKVVEKTDEIAKVLAERIEPFKGTNVQYFYHTGPIIQKAVDMGVPREQAEKQLYDFALNYAVTSPRTMTEQNLRNASLVATKETLDIPLTTIVGPGQKTKDGINEKGYPMMIGPTGIHKKLTDEKKLDELNADLNPKPITFAQNVLGNLEGVTVDTHAIRAVFDVMNDLEPGSVPIEFIGGKNAEATKKFREMYTKDPSSLDVSNMIADTLQTQKIDGKAMQTEYAIFSDLYKKVAELAGVRPAEAQSLSWFANGQKTGLSSEPKTVVDLINDRVDVTAQILKQDKETVFKKFFEGKLPLLALPASVTLLDTGASMEGDDG